MITDPKSGCDFMEGKVGNGSEKRNLSSCNVEALKKCLEESKGDRLKCQSHVKAFRNSCSLKKPNSPPNAV
ncbi:hypothetical protein Syun_025902 [Stephania yunnanensis]|uniref:Uncharacterized protein n=1 Tax=Stephania yunnanensis TaxID=152371 RepID=A0AAP0EVF8_9MAGN